MKPPGQLQFSLFEYMTLHIAVRAALLGACGVPVWVLSRRFRPQLRFMWYAMLQPWRAAKTGQKERLDDFYNGQAEIYDATRDRLTQGRESMLSLCASHLRVLNASSPKRRLVWVDIGGGTGSNIELMDKYFPISSFDAVYLIDLCEPLLEVARRRFATRGWENVTILCQDAQSFELPEWSDVIQVGEGVDLITLSYSLSMMDGFHCVLDRVHQSLSPQNSILGVVDFYTNEEPHYRRKNFEKPADGSKQEFTWFSRWFWRIFFDLDHVCLSPHRRSYLQHKFGTVKCYEERNTYIPFLVQIPYYVWIGRPRSCDVSKISQSLKDSEVKGTNLVSNKATSLGTFAPPLNHYYYHVGTPWRMPYYDNQVHEQFRTYIYSFTWEDPEEDMRHLDLTADDSVLAITSGGDSVLHYAISAGPARIHCVDMNPCQGHLVELKLAAIHALEYDEFFAMFGEGRHPDFRNLLDTKIAPHISAAAYEFWRTNDDAFSSAFYLRGYSGWAIYLMGLVFKLAGASQHVKDLCNAENLQEQERIWWTHLRPVMLNPVVVALLKHPTFCWNALGVPLNQRKMLLDDGGVYEYVRDSLDPLASTYLLKTGAYFYLLGLLGHYTHESCPAYLTRSGFAQLKANSSKAINAFRLHTDSLLNVFQSLPDKSLTRVIVMDHLDWFAPGSADVDAEIENLFRLLDVGGSVFWRSAARTPWYNANFAAAGFQLTALGVRTGPEIAIDRVNMYASFFKATKIK
ncbi:hypothetical protein DFH07DRAFT_936438 [Mycena maculata]|uniref:Methyltransferase type 12 domain-containing protein n=1 Tax=Mycena maculata TaxID=230809 RepID=A0AAD7K5W8_9AGAR|nr:hypothetical protein DFH07DRAFT_936438 [Mycena maculata]